MNTWILQKNFSPKPLVDCLEKLGVPYIWATPIPFSEGELQAELNFNGPVVIHGTSSLIKAAMKRGWAPGAFISEETFDPELWVMKHGQNMLNSDSVIMTLDEGLPQGMNKAFVRPCDDFKGFTGQVFEREELRAFAACFYNPKLKVMASSPKEVSVEWRLFFVDGIYISGSRYRPFFEDYVPDDVVDFARELSLLWSPSTSFVMDICLVHDELKVVEYNCINGAGYYMADLQKIVEALTFAK